VSDALTVDLAANGTSIGLHSGQTLIIRLPENPSTGYGWRPVAGIGAHLVLAGKNYTADRPVPGAPGIETFTLTAGKPGFDALRFALFPPGRHRPPAKFFHLKVTIHRA
jgi:inhibitor of cysteine peptidase